ncbi:MAG TPA: hypothetical protein VHM94_01470 [Acidimicrobiia bacterium]|jgi:hypothetical protein|nr:hypothetical protein [Acidimicrobiia bacterium]
MIEPTVHSRPKSKLAAFALGFFFGPLGLFYVTTPGKVILMVLGAALLGVGTDGFAWFLAMIGVAIYAPIAAGQYNEKLAALQADHTDAILSRELLRVS